jgi:hypothetical protein
MKISMSIAVLVSLALICGQVTAAPITTAFTYQGHFKQGGVPANGLFDFQFLLRREGGTTPVCFHQVEVVNGFFIADFDIALASFFNGSAIDLDVAVKKHINNEVETCQSVGESFDPNYTALSPTQPITPAPYALHALSAPTGSSLDAPDGSPLDALLVDNSGRVGIGTTTPDTTLNIVGPSAFFDFIGAPGQFGFQLVGRRAGGTAAAPLATSATNVLAEFGGAGFDGSSFQSVAGSLKISAVENWTPGAHGTQMSFQTTASGTITPFTRLFIAENGNVGIGTSSPSQLLEVNSDSQPVIRIRSINANGASILRLMNLFTSAPIFGAIEFQTGNTVKGSIAYRGVENAMTFAVNEAERVRIDAEGNVGIGTSNPAHPLHIVRPVQQPLVVENTGGVANSSGVLAKVSSTTGQAVRGEAIAATGVTVGVTGISTSTTGIGVFGEATAATGNTHGVHGKVVSGSGFAGFFEGRGSFSNDVAIGVTGSIDARLHVQESGRVAKFDRFGSDGELVAWARDDATLGSVSIAGGVVSYNAFTGSHYARASTSINPGALVSMTGENHRYDNRPGAEVVYGVVETARANDPACLGVLLGPLESTKETGPDNPLLVAAVGNGEIWVVDCGGRDIEPGDFLTSSDVSGHAMKDDPGRFPIGYIVARAAERVRWSELEERGSDGLKHKMISVLFENFVRNSEAMQLAEELRKLRAVLDLQRSEIDALRSQFSSN